MSSDPVAADTLKKFLQFQKDEITGYHAYRMLAERVKDDANSAIIRKIAEQEMQHYRTWKKYTHQEVPADRLKVFFYTLCAHLFGFTFVIKLMEKGEETTQQVYRTFINAVPGLQQMLDEEAVHENELVAMLDEEALRYAGSVVLGLNDALVELTGALAGLTFAFQNTRLTALAGLITGISASFSMAASEYLSVKSESSEQSPAKSALYTGVAYVLTVLFLILPYLLFNRYVAALIFTLINAVVVIAIFNYYVSVVKAFSFRSRFLEMTAISLGVAFLSFIIGSVIRSVFRIEI